MDNPLRSFGGGSPRQARSLDDYCDWLNRLNFVAASGKPYRIATNERGERYLDRQA